MKLNREQIIKALECCISGDDCTLCPLCDERSCPCVLNENALSLIKELTEENERLKGLRTIDERYKFCNLIGDTLVYNKTLEDYNKFRANWRADTVRKMLDRITEHATNGFPRKVRLDVVEQIGKEILEGTK